MTLFVRRNSKAVYSMNNSPSINAPAEIWDNYIFEIYQDVLVWYWHFEAEEARCYLQCV